MKAEDFLNQGTAPAGKGPPPGGMSAEAFLGMPTEKPVEAFSGMSTEKPIEQPAGPALVQDQPPSMFGRGLEAVKDFLKPSFAPEPTAPVGLEDLQQAEYGAAMTRPISTITGEPVPTPEEAAAGGRAAMAIVPYGFASAVRGMVPGALERAVMDPIAKAVVGKEYVSPIDEALKIGKYLPEEAQVAIGAPAHMAGAVVPLSISFKTAGAMMKAAGLPADLVLSTGPVMDRVAGHVVRGGLAGAVYGGLEGGTPKDMAEDAAFFGALEGGLGAVGGIFRKIFASNWFRNIEVSERGLVVQTADDLLKAGHSEGTVLRTLGDPVERARLVEEAIRKRATAERPTQKDIIKETIREEMIRKPEVPAVPGWQAPPAPPFEAGIPPAGPPPSLPGAPGALPPGQGFGLVEPTPEIRLRPGPERIVGPEYPEGAEYVAGRGAPEDLEIEHKPILSTRGLPWKEQENALKALKSREDVSPATHKVVKVKKGYGIVPLVDKGTRVTPEAKPEEVKGKTLVAFVRAMGGIKDATLPGEVRALSGKETGVVGLTTSMAEKGLAFDEMALAAVEHGWLPENLENVSGAFSELLRDDIFAQKEGKQRAERLEAVAKRVEREERWKEYERSEDDMLEYFAKHPEEEATADLDNWQRETITEIRRRSDEKTAAEVEESVAREVEAENPEMEELKSEEGFPEFVEGWADLLDEKALAEVEAWRAGEEKPVEAEPEVSNFEEMVSAAQKWQGAAYKVDKSLGEDTKARLAHSKMTTKGDLDAYLMRQFGIDEAAARDVSNEITRMNLKPDETAEIADFKDEPWAKAKPKEPIAKPEEKQPWEMKKEEWVDGQIRSPALHREHVKKALKSNELTPERYAELHEKDYGPIGEFVPEVAGKGREERGLFGEKAGPTLRESEALYAAEPEPFMYSALTKAAESPELALAFGGKKKADEAIEAVAKKVDFVSYRRMPDRVARREVPKTNIAQEIRKNKRVDLSGRKLTKGRESQEIAELFQVYRSPKMETLHSIYTAKDGTILGHNAITSGQIDSVGPGDMTKYIFGMQSAAKRLGAHKVHLLHNHPSGNPTMSNEDVAFANRLRKKSTPEKNGLGDLLGEFIVINHGKFTYVDEYLKSGETYVSEGKFKVIPGTGEWMEKKGPSLSSPQAVAAFGKNLAYDKTKACFVYVDTNNSVVGWSTHDNKILKKSASDLEKILRQQAKGHDAAKTIIIAEDMALLRPLAEHVGVGDWLLDALDAKGNSLRERVPDVVFADKRTEIKPARRLFEPGAEYGREVISKDGTSVDWDKSKTITKEKVTHKCYATYNKDGSFKKWRTREAINKIKALKKAEVKYKDQLGRAKERFDVRVEKIKTAKDIIKRRREKIKAIRDYFHLSDADLKKITKRDIRLMSTFEFKQFIDDIRVKAEKFVERRQAANEMELLRKEKAFINEDNIRKFHKLPLVKNMTHKQLEEYAEILSGYERGDQFLTPKRIKGLEQTLWRGSKTIREVLEKASKEFDVPLSELSGIRVSEIDRFRYDTSLARQNAFYNFMVDSIGTAEIKNQFKYFKEREKLYRLAKAALKSRKRGILERLVPRQKDLMNYIEAEGDARIEFAEKLTIEEIALAAGIEDFYRRAYNWLLISQELKNSRFKDKYVMHAKRPISELLIDLKDTGIKSAAKDLLNRWKLDEAQFKILDSKTGEILRMKKFFRQTLYRTGELTPTKNIVKATDIYMQQFFKKMALDESVPAIETLAMALRPKEKTRTGIFLNDSLMTFVKEYLNTKKGRAINIGIQQGGRVDTVIRFVNQIISLRYIAFNIPLELAAIVGETTAKVPALGNRRLILANKRRFTARGRRILKKYKAYTGEGVLEEALQPARNIGENINLLLYGLFKWSRKVTKQDILLGNMTKAEFEAEAISPEKLAAMTKLAGRWLDIEGAKSIMGTTSTGAAITKFKGWAIPIVSSTAQNAASLARTLTRVGDPKKRLTQQQFQELYRIAEMGAIVVAVMALDVDDDDKDTFVGRLKHYAIRELGTIYNALSPRTMLTFGVTIAFLEKLSQNLYTLMTLEKYKTKDELKGVRALEKQLTPAAITQFKVKKKKEPEIKKPGRRLKSRVPGGRLSGRLK